MNLFRPLSLLALFAATVAAHAQTVVDGSFEGTPLTADTYQYAPTGTAWTYTYPAGLANGSTPWHDAAQSGDQYGYVQSGSGVAGAIAGSITGLTVGQAYDLTFYLGSRGGYEIDPLTVTVGTDALARGVAPADDMSGTGWTKFDLSFTATSAMASIGFTGSDPGPSGDLNTAIDNVSVSPVPEPAPLTALGLGALGLLRRRRR